MDSVEKSLVKINQAIQSLPLGDRSIDLGEINKSLQEINQSLIGTGDTILDLNKTLTRMEDYIRLIAQNSR